MWYNVRIRERETMTTFEIIQSETIKALKAMPSESVHNVITDGVWGINFLSLDWDNFATAAIAEKSKDHLPKDNKKQTARPACMHAGQYTNTRKANVAFQEFTYEWATEAYRILYPGGFVLSMCGTRTYHAMVSGIEAAGFEIKDTISHIFASGFPKSHKVVDKMNEADAKEWEGWQTPMLKPAQIFVVVAQKPIEGTFAENLIKYRVGGFNINATRVTGGRFPANFTLDEAVEDLGGISRYFFVSKASLKEKEAGLENFEAKALKGRDENQDKLDTPFKHRPGKDNVDRCPTCKAPLKPGAVCKFHPAQGSRTYNARCKNCGKKFIGSPNTICSCDNPQTDESVFKRKNNHPTVQSVEFFKYIIQLVAAPNTIVLDIFCGSGTTGCAAADLPNLNLHFIGIDQDKHYCDLSEARIQWWIDNQPPDIFRGSEDGL